MNLTFVLLLKIIAWHPFTSQSLFIYVHITLLHPHILNPKEKDGTSYHLYIFHLPQLRVLFDQH